MFGFTKNKFKESDKRLFRYSDGTRWRFADPFFTWRKYREHDKIDDHEAMGALVDQGKEPETTIFIDALCEVFGVHRWNETSGTGLTEAEIVDLLNQLAAWFEAVKKNGAGSSTSSPPTDSTPSTSQEPQNPATN